MSTLKNRMAASIPFAHLMGFRAEDNDDIDLEEKKDEWSKKAENDPEREKKDDEDDEDYVSRMKAMDEEEENEESDEKKKSAKSEEGDDKENEKDENTDKREARRAERDRCAKIIAHGIKNGCVNQAAVFAFDTKMSVKTAIASMHSVKADNKRAGLSQKMSDVHIPILGSGQPESLNVGTPAGMAKIQADSILQSLATSRGEKIQGRQ